jgi:hypothetical protein
LGQTSFTGLTYSPNRVHVFQNGVRLVDGTDYTATNGTSLTLTVGALVNDQVVVVSYSGFQTSDTVSASAGGTFTGDVNFTGAFTSQGIDDNATSTAMTLDGSGNLLVGSTTYDSSLAGQYLSANGKFYATVDGSAAARFARLSNDGEIVRLLKDTTTVGSIGSHSGYITLGNGDTSLIFDSTANSIEPFNQNDRTSEDAAITLGWSSNRFKDLYLSGGVYLGGTGSANKLDDYESGNWTPTYLRGGTATYVINSGRYTKVGNVVHLQCHLDIGSLGTASGDVEVIGLPFTAANDSVQYASISSIHGSGWAIAADNLNGLILPNTTNIWFYRNTGSSSIVKLNHQYLGVGNLLFNVTYRTTV